jgi:hypothetical protein
MLFVKLADSVQNGERRTLESPADATRDLANAAPALDGKSLGVAKDRLALHVIKLREVRAPFHRLAVGRDEPLDAVEQKPDSASPVGKDESTRHKTTLAPTLDRLARDVESRRHVVNGEDGMALVGCEEVERAADFFDQDAQVVPQRLAGDELVRAASVFAPGDPLDHLVPTVSTVGIDIGDVRLGGVQLSTPHRDRRERQLSRQACEGVHPIAIHYVLIIRPHSLIRQGDSPLNAHLNRLRGLYYPAQSCGIEAFHCKHPRSHLPRKPKPWVVNPSICFRSLPS